MVDDERSGVVWIDGSGAVVGTWEGEPRLQRLDSEVTPRRRAVGSVRRGPARPFGGGRVGGSGTEEQHARELRQFLADVAESVADLDVVEVTGRGLVHEQFAALLEKLGARDGQLRVLRRPLSRRPTEPQMAARVRKLAGQSAPRRGRGPYRPEKLEEAPFARPAAGPETFRNPRPRHLPERLEIEQELELLLAPEERDPEG